MDKTDRTTVIELLGDSLKTQIMLMNSFSEDEIGSKMTPNYIAVHSGISVRQAMHELIEQAAEEDLKEPLTKSIGKRLPWLVILLGLGMVVSSVIGIFEGIVAQLPLIIAFQSLILIDSLYVSKIEGRSRCCIGSPNYNHQ
jgi:Mg/Co/Ni transporter MgtE